MGSGKAVDYKLFQIGNEKDLGGVGVFLAKKWVHKVIDISSVRDEMIAINVLVQIIILFISVYAPQSD